MRSSGIVLSVAYRYGCGTLGGSWGRHRFAYPLPQRLVYRDAAKDLPLEKIQQAHTLLRVVYVVSADCHDVWFAGIVRRPTSIGMPMSVGLTVPVLAGLPLPAAPGCLVWFAAE